MKKTLIVFALLILSNFAQGQWYFKKYQVKDINLLTRAQLDESLKDSRNFLYGSGLCALVGGGFLLANKYGLWESDQNPSPLEELIGRKSLHDIYGGIGIALIAGGTIAFFGYLERCKNIRIVMHRNFPTIGSLHLSPRVIYNKYNTSGNYGLALNWNF